MAPGLSAVAGLFAAVLLRSATAAPPAFCSEDASAELLRGESALVAALRPDEGSFARRANVALAQLLVGDHARALAALELLAATDCVAEIDPPESDDEPPPPPPTPSEECVNVLRNLVWARVSAPHLHEDAAWEAAVWPLEDRVSEVRRARHMTRCAEKIRIGRLNIASERTSHIHSRHFRRLRVT